LVADARLVDEIWRNLAVIYLLHSQTEQLVFGA